MLCRTLLALTAASILVSLAWEGTAQAQGYPQTYPPQTQPAQPGYPTTGYPNTGYPNTGYPNTGYPTTGYPNTGYPTTGYPATGYPNTGYPTTGYPNTGYPTTQPVKTTDRNASDVELGVLYGMSAAYGANLGVWIDTEAGLGDPGLLFIAPVALGIAAPVGVYFANQPRMPVGMPAAISAGMFIGAGEGMAIWSRQFTSAKEGDAWGWPGFSRAVTLGSTFGTIGGFAVGYFQEPSPKNSTLTASSAMWGGIVGSMIGYGATPADWSGYGKNNDGASMGGLVGYNVGIGAGAALSMIYTPSWMNLAWMWIGGGIGAAAGLPVYLAYAGSDSPARRGLIVQGIFTGLGIVAGGVLSSGLKDDDYINIGNAPQKPQFAQVTTFGFMPVNGGGGVQVAGILF